MRFNRLLPLLLVAIASPDTATAGAMQFCLDGEFDLGARYQGMRPAGGEFYPARWCVITEDDSENVRLSMRGKSNPDMDGGWTVAFLPPALVRIINADAPPDIEFQGADSLFEARRNRRIDPHRLVEELEANPDWVTTSASSGLQTVRYPGEQDSAVVEIIDGKLKTVRTTADVPLRGRVPVIWHWLWGNDSPVSLLLEVDNEVVFRARGSWRSVADSVALWQPTPGAEPAVVPGENWPARVDMRLVPVTEGVHLVQGVRTGFQHLVIETSGGLVVADAPAGWVELHQIPSADLVPGLGISGLSEQLIDFLGAEFPGERVRAVALTHAHDDHAGGARAFAAAGAAVYAPAEVAAFLQSALNADSMPADRLSEMGGEVEILPVAKSLTLDDASHPVVLLPLGAGPHAGAALGLHVVEQGVFFQSDLHVPRTESDSPRPDRAATECWFATWAVEHLPAATLVINTHSAVQTPVSRLAAYLDSPVCLDAAIEP